MNSFTSQQGYKQSTGGFIQHQQQHQQLRQQQSSGPTSLVKTQYARVHNISYPPQTKNASVTITQAKPSNVSSINDEEKSKEATSLDKKKSVEDAAAHRRMKNREAARKCRENKRKRDQEKVSKLETTASKHEEENIRLQNEIRDLHMQRNAWINTENRYILCLNLARRKCKIQSEYIKQLTEKYLYITGRSLLSTPTNNLQNQKQLEFGAYDQNRNNQTQDTQNYFQKSPYQQNESDAVKIGYTSELQFLDTQSHGIQDMDNSSNIQDLDEMPEMPVPEKNHMHDIQTIQGVPEEMNRNDFDFSFSQGNFNVGAPLINLADIDLDELLNSSDVI